MALEMMAGGWACCKRACAAGCTCLRWSLQAIR